MKNWLLLSLWFLSVLITTSCNYERNKQIDDPAITTNKSRFAVIQKSIIETKCLTCHSASNPSDGINLSSYQEIIQSRTIVPGKPSESKFFLSVQTRRMPKGSSALSTSELELIQNWITEGAREVDLEVGAPTPTPVVPAALPTYQWISKNIIQTKCVVCHNTAKPRGKVDLSSYEALMASTGNKTKPVIVGNSEESTLYIEVAEQKMPPTIKALTPLEIKAIYDWILAGAQPSEIPPPTPPGTPPTPPEPKYGWLSRNVFSRRCGNCHGIPFKVANVDFTSLDTLLNSSGKTAKPLVAGDPEHSSIYNEITSGHMPPPRKVMTEEEIKVVKQWIDEGAQNN